MSTKSQTPSQIEFKHIIRCCYKSKVASDKIIQGLEISEDPNKFMNEALTNITTLPSYKAYNAMKPKYGNIIGKMDVEDD